MLDNLKNLAGLMGQAGKLKQKFEDMQAQLGQMSVEADAGAGAVRVVMNGRFEVLAVRLDPTMIATLAGEGAEADQQMVEELIAAAVNAAVAKTQQLIKDEMASMTGGLDIPGLDKMLGG